MWGFQGTSHLNMVKILSRWHKVIIHPRDTHVNPCCKIIVFPKIEFQIVLDEDLKICFSF